MVNEYSMSTHRTKVQSRHAPDPQNIPAIAGVTVFHPRTSHCPVPTRLSLSRPPYPDVSIRRVLSGKLQNGEANLRVRNLLANHPSKDFFILNDKLTKIHEPSTDRRPCPQARRSRRSLQQSQGGRLCRQLKGDRATLPLSGRHASTRRTEAQAWLHHEKCHTCRGLARITVLHGPRNLHPGSNQKQSKRSRFFLQALKSAEVFLRATIDTSTKKSTWKEPGTSLVRLMALLFLPTMQIYVRPADLLSTPKKGSTVHKGKKDTEVTLLFFELEMEKIKSCRKPGESDFRDIAWADVKVNPYR